MHSKLHAVPHFLILHENSHWVCGGAQLARRMMALDLIDVYQLTVMPVILGGGVRLFPPEGPALPLRLTRHTVCNGVVELVYVRRDAPPPV